MDHAPQDRQNPSAPPTNAELVSNGVSAEPVALRRASGGGVPNSGGYLANADRSENAANDELVAELVRRMRAGQTCGAGASLPRTTETTALPHRATQ